MSVFPSVSWFAPTNDILAVTIFGNLTWAISRLAAASSRAQCVASDAADYKIYTARVQ
jgi:hypothetical protein